MDPGEFVGCVAMRLAHLIAQPAIGRTARHAEHVREYPRDLLAVLVAVGHLARLDDHPLDLPTANLLHVGQDGADADLVAAPGGPVKCPIRTRIEPLDIGHPGTDDRIEHAEKKSRRRNQAAPAGSRRIGRIGEQGIVVAQPPGVMADDVLRCLLVPALDAIFRADRAARLRQRLQRESGASQSLRHDLSFHLAV